MLVKTKLSEQAEQFEIDGKCYVGRRVFSTDEVDQDAFHLFTNVEKDIFGTETGWIRSSSSNSTTTPA